jgi:DNA-binding winged helix-turn-helix (wHTH) protein/TolB-like protein
LNPAEGQLLRGGEVLTLTPKAFEALVLLVENRGHLLEKEELMKALWPDTFVEEANLAHHIWRLRRVLEDTKDDERYIETVPKRGYRFVASVTAIDDHAVSAIIERHTITRLVAERETERDSDSLQPVRIDASPGAQQWFAINIRTLVGATVGVAVLLASALYLTSRGVSSAVNSPPTSPITTLAVLPFKPLTNETSDPSLELGMADALITRLSNLKELTVRPTSAVTKYSSANEDLSKVGHELRVESVLIGRVQRVSDRIRVTVQLIRTDAGKPLWADTFDERSNDIFALEDSLSHKLARALALRLTAAETSRMQQHYTNNIEAYQAYLKGRYQMNQAAEGAFKAVASFEEAIQKDPKFALAYAGLADVHFFFAFAGFGPPGEQINKSKAAALKALELDDSLAEAHISLANILVGYDWKWTEAEREFKRALELNPNSAEAHHSYSNYLQAMTRFDEGLAEIKRAEELDPLSLGINFHHGLCLFAMGRPDEALVQYRKTLDIDSSTGAMGSHWGIAIVYEERRMYEEAIRELEEAKRLDPRPKWRMTGLVEAYALAGRRKEASDMLAQLLELRKQEFVSPFAIAIGQIYAALGDLDQAFAWFNKAIDERESIVVALKAMKPSLQKSVLEDPRYALLLQRVGL